MSIVLVRVCVGVLVWGAAIAGTLSISQWSGNWGPGNWGHGVCGPWGCGPTVQALVSCHLAWFVLLAPPAVLLANRAKRAPRRLGLALVLLAVASILFVVAYEWFTWWPAVSQWQRPYFLHRIGFVIVTAIDYPILQTLVIGVLLLGKKKPVQEEPCCVASEEGLACEEGQMTPASVLAE